MHEIRVMYDRAIIRKAVGRFWIRFISWHGFVALGLVLTAFIVLLLSGNRSWELGAIGMVCLFGMAAASGLYFTLLSRSYRKLAKMPSGSVRYVFSDNCICVDGDLSRGEFSWKTIERVWKFPEVWLMFIGRGAYFTLPVRDMDEATRAFIDEQMARHRGSRH